MNEGFKCSVRSRQKALAGWLREEKRRGRSTWTRKMKASSLLLYEIHFHMCSCTFITNRICSCCLRKNASPPFFEPLKFPSIVCISFVSSSLNGLLILSMITNPTINISSTSTDFPCFSKISINPLTTPRYCRPSFPRLFTAYIILLRRLASASVYFPSCS